MKVPEASVISDGEDDHECQRGEFHRCGQAGPDSAVARCCQEIGYHDDHEDEFDLPVVGRAPGGFERDA
jgi:hypothetical protein